MKINVSILTLALAVAATPLAAQIAPRGGGASRTGTRIETTQDVLDAARSRAGIEAGRTAQRDSRIPPGHLPPRGMCRVWIDGVPPGHQPAVTSCAQAERDRFRYSNARVIYGDSETFRGRAKGKFKNADGRTASQRRCSIWDGIVMNGSVTNVCRDDSVIGDRSGSVRSRDDWDDDADSDRHSKAEKKFDKQNRKAAKKGGRGR